MLLGSKTTDQITHSDWSNFVMHTTCPQVLFYSMVTSDHIKGELTESRDKLKKNKKENPISLFQNVVTPPGAIS